MLHIQVVYQIYTVLGRVACGRGKVGPRLGHVVGGQAMLMMVMRVMMVIMMMIYSQTLSKELENEETGIEERLAERRL